MVKMPFRRKTSNTTQLPKEISDYYQAEKKQRLGAAWILSIVTFIATVLIVLGLFFAGRWIYRQVTKKDTSKPAPTSVQDKPADSKSTSNGSSSSSSSTPASPAPSASTPPPTAPSTSTAPSQSATTTPKPNQVPNTGPGNIAAVFTGITVLGTVAYQIVLRRRISD